MYKIMIIEDNAKIRSELGEFLSKNGYEAVSYTHLHTFSMLILRIIDEPTPKPHTAKNFIPSPPFDLYVKVMFFSI